MRLNYKKNIALVLSLILSSTSADLGGLINKHDLISADETVSKESTQTKKTFVTDINKDGITDQKDEKKVLECIGKSTSEIKKDNDNSACDVYQDDVIDIRDASVINKVINKKSTDNIKSGDSLSTADIYVESVTCAGGDKVIVSVGIVDWTQDIESLEINLDFDSVLNLNGIKTLGNISYASEKNKIKLYGFCDKKDAYRGRIASLEFTVPDPDEMMGYKVNVSSASLYNSSLEKYISNYTNGIITADSSLKPSSLQAAEINSKSVNLQWKMNKQSERSSGYIVFRDGVEISRTKDMSYFDKGLASGTEYTYTIQEYGEDGYLSPVSRPLKVKACPAVISDISFEKNTGCIGGETANINFTMNAPTHLKEYKIFSINSKKEKKLIYTGDECVLAAGKFEWNINDLVSGQYSIQIDMTDIDGAQISLVSEPVTADKDAPEPVYGFSAYTGDECVSMTWGISSQLNTVKYNIYRRTKDGKYECIGSADGRNTLDFIDKTAKVGEIYYYNITAVDCFGQESAMTDEVSSSSKDDQSPPDVTLFMPESGTVISGTTVIYAQAVDNISVAKLKCFESLDNGQTWKEIHSTDGGSAQWNYNTAGYEEQDVMLKVIAYDNEGNESKGTNVHSYHVDNKAPEKVKGLSLTEAYDTYATIAWSDVADNDRKYFIIEYTNTATGEVQTTYTYTTLGINLTGLSADTEYSVTVTAVDAMENKGEKSDKFVFKTKADCHIPEILSISPEPGYYKEKLPLKIFASDNVSVKSVAVEISQDCSKFERLAEIPNESGSAQFYAEYDLDLTPYPDGKIYIRAIAYDSDKNASSDKTIIMEYVVDTLKPEKMKNIKLNNNSNSMELQWSNYENDQIDYFRIFKKEADSDKYTLLADNIRSLNYFDRAIEPGKQYSYKISAVDAAGNESEMSDPCTGKIEADTTAPVIESISPDNKNKLTRTYNHIGVLASDNVCLSEIFIEYYSGDTEKEYIPLSSQKYDIYYGLLDVEIPEAEIKNGNRIHIRAYAVDKSGNKSEYSYAEYEVDDSSTNIKSVECVQSDSSIEIKWSAEESKSTLGYYIYRKINDGEYELICTAPVDSLKNGVYSIIDDNISSSGIFIYKVVVENENSNKTTMESEEIEVLRTPEVSIGCDDMMEKDVEYIFDASASSDFYGISDITIDFGDGTSKTVTKAEDAKFVHKYSSSQKYTVKVTCKNIKGLTSSVSKTVEVAERSLMGEVSVVVKTTDGKAASNIDVYCDVGTESQIKKRTDSNGEITFKTSAGIHAIGVYSDGYLPDIKNCTVVAGSNNPIEFSVVEQDIVTAQFDTQRMTLDEIKAVGIDVTDPQNQNVMKVNVHLQYSLEAGSDQTIYVGGIGGYARPYFSSWQIPSQNGKPGRQIEPVAVVLDEITNEVETLILLDIPVEATYLKEFFDVKLHIINNASSEYSMYDNAVNLNVPDGMTLMDALNCNAMNTYIKEIKGQTQKTLEWVIRGDKKGTYKLTADYKGTLSKFNEDFKRTFESDEIKVYGDDAVKVDMYIPDQVDGNDMYVKLAVTNMTDVDVYNVSAIIKDVVSSTFETIKDVSVKPYINTLSAPGGETVNISPDKINGNYGIETLNGGYTYSVIYHLAGIFADGINPKTGEMVNFNDQIVYLVDSYINRTNDSDTKFTLHVVDESEITTKYDHSNDIENLQRLSNETRDDLELLINGNNLSVTEVAELLRSSWPFIESYEDIDDLIDFLLNCNFDDFNDVDKNQYIDSVILDLLVSEQIRAEIQDKFKNNILSFMVKSLNTSFGKLETDVVYGSYIVDAMEYFENNESAVTEAINNFNIGGSSAVATYIVTQVYNEITAPENIKAVITEILNETLANDIRTYLSLTVGSGNIKDQVEDQWNQYLNIMMLKCVKEEAEMLLTTLAEPCSDDDMSILVSNRAQKMLNSVRSSNMINIINSGKEMVSTAVEYEVGRICGNAISTVISASGGPLGSIIYNMAGIGYESVKDDIDNKYLLPAKVLILDDMSNCVIRDLKVKIKSDDVTAMKYVEYLSKLRIEECSTCKTFIYSFESNKNNTAYTSTPLVKEWYEIILNNTSIEELTDDIIKLQFSADSLFIPSLSSAHHDQIGDVKYDYAKNQTTKSFDNTYEYRINEGEWQDCSGPVSVQIDTTTPLLQIRKKAVDGGIAGEVKNIRLARKDYFEGDLKVVYKNGEYNFEKIGKAKTIQFVFSDSETVSEDEWIKAGVYNGTPVKSSVKYKYDHVRIAPASDRPASQTKTTLVVSDSKVLIGSSSGGKASGDGTYAYGESVTVTAIPDAECTFAGWMINGKIVSDKTSYTFTVNDDTTIYAKFLSQSNYKITLSSNNITAVKVTGNCIEGMESIYVVSATCNDENLIFSHWEDENGNIVSTLETCPIAVDGDSSLQAIYITKE